MTREAIVYYAIVGGALALCVVVLVVAQLRQLWERLCNWGRWRHDQG